MSRRADLWASAHPSTEAWFEASFAAPTRAQREAWPPIADRRSTLLLAPTGSGKTLAAFLFAIDRLMFAPEPERGSRCRVLYVSPLKALGVDVERNLRAPIAGIAAVAERRGDALLRPVVGVRSGDTTDTERARMLRHPPDILITTPESLYLLLTSEARQILASVDTVIVDEIHSVVASKRGTHLFLSLERLESLVSAHDPERRSTGLQRIGLSATQRPLDEVARLLGGGEATDDGWRPRPVEIVDAGAKKALDLRVEVPVDDMGRLGETETIGSGPAASRLGVASIWPSIHPRLVELVRTHRSTMIFVNSRRLAERLANALNDLAGEEIALAHHGSLSKDKRRDIEERLKIGALPAIVATSSLELGIDMGAVDLVLQIEAPPSIASGLQRIGRGGHHVGATSKGVFFPKFRGDLVACATATTAMHEGLVEETFYPRNPLDVLAQQIVAIVSVTPSSADEVYQLVRGAAPFADLPRSSFEGVLDMLSGRYPSEEFAPLRPRINWDRISGRVEGRRGSKRIAVVNAGTIPDRGLYGVFLASSSEGTGATSRRVGELDEEMVFETHPGDVFLLGASSWRVEGITHDRVLVTPAPGEPGRMPFWRGDGLGRPVEFGRKIGALVRRVTDDPVKALGSLVAEHGLDDRGAKNLVAYVEEQAAATGEVPSDRTVVVERFIDEVGDWRVCVMTPFGARVHAPWGNAVLARLRDRYGGEVDLVWSDDGMVFRIPEADQPPDASLFFLEPDEVKDRVIANLFDTSLFAGRFRENAARALLLPRRRPGHRSPLWAQRRRSADLLKVASKYADFPIVLETFRECLQDVFDLSALTSISRDILSRKIRVHTVDTQRPSPFAASLLFGYVAHFIYDGDAPLAERRAQILSIDHAQLRELLGDAEVRDLFDAELIEHIERRLQRLEETQRIRDEDDLHDTLLAIGDLDREELRLRVARSEEEDKARLIIDSGSDTSSLDAWLETLIRSRRIVEVPIGGVARFIAAVDMGRYRDALGVVPPKGLPQAFLEPVHDALGQILGRYARTHGPFEAASVASRFSLELASVESTLRRLEADGRVVAGDFLPGRRGHVWCATEVLRSLKQHALAKLRREVEPVEATSLGRFLPDWQGITRPRRGLDGLLSVIEQLQGVAIPASILEQSLLPLRVDGYAPHLLDELGAAGEIVWRGLGSLGPNDGRIALYLTDHYPRLAPLSKDSPPKTISQAISEPLSETMTEPISETLSQTISKPVSEPISEPLSAGILAGSLVDELRALFRARGAMFFGDLVEATHAFPQDLSRALWDLVWSGELTNDTLRPLRSLFGARDGKSTRRSRPRVPTFRGRRLGPPGTEGRWSLLPSAMVAGPSGTERRTALALQLLERHGILTREAVHQEGLDGGFSLIYPVLKAMEEAGRIRRGYFIEGLGASQFALPGAVDRLRQHRSTDLSEPPAIVLAAADPANPYGAALSWPTKEGCRLARTAGARVVLWGGRLIAHLSRSESSISTFLPDREPERGHAARALASVLTKEVESAGRRALLVTSIDGEEPAASFLVEYFEANGYFARSRGFFRR